MIRTLSIVLSLSAVAFVRGQDAPPVTNATAAAQDLPKAPSEDSPEIKALRDEIKLLGLRRDKLALENALRGEAFKQEIAPLNEEKERLAIRAVLERERLAADLLKARLELDRLAFESESIEKKLALSASRFRQDVDGRIADMRLEEEVVKASNSLATTRSAGLLNEWKFRAEQIKQEQSEAQSEISRMEIRLKSLQTEGSFAGAVGRDRIVYDQDPFRDGALYISDRRIALNGAVTYELAEQVTTRINYYNNLSTNFPIFIVIDSSPGGSVAAGETILKAMQGSKAPVYVVVKSFAASMAAVITSLAEKSYAYPNALILHHQLMYGAMGNLKQQKQAMEHGQEWFRRIATPIAQRMGLTMDQFVAKMYENDADGNWKVFGDEAKKLAWVTHTVDRIHETSLLNNPDRPQRIVTSVGPTPVPAPERSGFLPAPTLVEQIDEKGKPFVRLPRLMPFDCYFLFDPDQYYRAD